MIRFKDVTKIYAPDTVALDQVNFEVGQEFVTIAGKSGAGKTTLLELILAKQKPTRGQVFFDEFKVDQAKSKQIAELRQKMGAIFQDYKLIPSKTAFQNVAYAMEVVGVPNQEIKERVPQVLEIVEMEDKSEHLPDQLSEGEQQRVAIARALITRPKIVLADEPTGNLDPYRSQDIIQLLLKINKLGTTVILATHDKEIINSLEKRVISLRAGKVISDQDPGKFVL